VAPQVKVRLQVDGTPEAIAAIRAFQAQAKSAGAEAQKAFNLKGALSGAQGLLGGLGIAIGTAEIVRFGKETIEAAVAQKHMAEQIGTTVGHMSALGAAAKLANADEAQLTAGLGILAKNIDRLRAGEPAMTAAFARLGLSAKSFTSDDIVVSADMVAKALDRIADGGTKTAIAIALMGRNGKSLIPTFSELVKLGGLGGAVDFAKRTGFYVDEATVAQFEALNQQMKLLQLYAQGAALEFLKGFGPTAVQTMDDLTKGVGKGAEEMKEFGQFIGFLVRISQALFVILKDIFEIMFATGASAIDHFPKLISALAGGNFKEAGAQARAFAGDLVTIYKNAGLEVGAAFKNAFTEPLAALGGSGGGKPDGAPKPPKDASVTAATKSALEAHRARIDAEIKDQEEQLKGLYERGLISLASYFNQRRALVEKSLQAEFDVFTGESAVASQEKDPEKRARELARIEDKQVAATIAAHRQVAQLDDEEAKMKDELHKADLEELGKLGKAKDAEHARELARIEEERIASQKRYVQEGESVDAAKARADAEAQVKIQALNLEVSLEEIERRVKEGLGPTLANFFGSTIDQAHNATDAVRMLGLELARMVQQIVASSILKGIFGALHLPTIGMAEGGYLSGPGGPTADRIPIMASAGEYIMPARVVGAPGVRAFLEAMRSGNVDLSAIRANPQLRGIQHFAEGGMVQPSTNVTPQIGGTISVGLDDGLILKALESPAGQNVMLRVVGKNRRAFGQALR
jgi:hypothetical protein